MSLSCPMTVRSFVHKNKRFSSTDPQMKNQQKSASLLDIETHSLYCFDFLRIDFGRLIVRFWPITISAFLSFSGTLRCNCSSIPHCDPSYLEPVLL